jgi:hypothetical protein
VKQLSPIILIQLLSFQLFAQPANDNPCTATSLTPGASCSFTTYDSSGATDSGEGNPLCGSYSTGDVWFSVTVPASGHLIIDSDVGGITDSGMAVYSGTCGALVLEECDDDDSDNGTMSKIDITGLTPASTLFIRFWDYYDGTGTFDLCVYEPAPPVNDDPCGAITLTAGGSCTYTASTNVNATASAGVPAPGCASYSTGDVWFKVDIPASGAIKINTSQGTITDGGMAVYTGTCGALTLHSCDDSNSPNAGDMPLLTVTDQAVSSTVFIRFWDYYDGEGTFNICVEEIFPPANDDPCNAIALTSGTSCSYTAGTNVDATASAGVPAPGCASYSTGDVWYKVDIPATGGVQINTSQGSITDGGMAVYTGGCGALTLHSCDDSGSGNPGNMPLLNITDQAVSSTIYIRFWDYNDGEGTFNICAQELNACGNLDNHDYCSSPAVLTKEPGTFTANTSNSYTYDEPANLTSVFCGAVDNNSWYEFVATATTEVFDFTSVSNCEFGDGIQAEVYEVTRDGNNCCTNFTSMSNCWNPATPTTGTVTATGLTVSNTYMLMVDGFSGDHCDFTVSDWTATGLLLPIRLISFDGISRLKSNHLIWKTNNENDYVHFLVEKSTDGINFEKISLTEGKTSNNKVISYQFEDQFLTKEINYYRIVLVDENGEKTYSKVISLRSPKDDYNELTLYPNPAVDFMTIKINGEIDTFGELSIQDVSGKEVLSIPTNKIGEYTFQIPLLDFQKGLYFIQYRSILGKSQNFQFVVQ